MASSRDNIPTMEMIIHISEFDILPETFCLHQSLTDTTAIVRISNGIVTSIHKLPWLSEFVANGFLVCEALDMITTDNGTSKPE